MRENLPREISPWAWIRAVHDIICAEPFESEALPVQITPWLYLSDLKAVWNIDPVKGTGAIMGKGITHVLTTNSTDPRSLQKLSRRLAAAGIQHHVVQGQDEEGYDMITAHWKECLTFIEKARDSGGKIVVHCVAGQNRSGLIVTAALMVLEKMTVLEAVRTVKAKRGIFLTNHSFQKQLCELAQKEGLLGEKPNNGYFDAKVET